MLYDKTEAMSIKYTEEQKELITAARVGDLPTVRGLAERGYPSDCELKYGSSALMIAASRGHDEIVRLLAAHGAKVNRRNRFGSSPLLEACDKGHPEVIRTLVELGADINMPHNNGSTVLLAAAVRRDVKVIRVLLELGADGEVKNFDGWSARSWVQSEANPALMEVFGIGRSDSKSKVGVQNEQGDAAKSEDRGTSVLVVNDALWIALMRAASNGDVRAVRELAEGGVEVNGQSPNGTTAIIAATKNGRVDAVFELLDLGADPMLADADGMDALAWAQKRNHDQIVEGLKQRGVTCPSDGSAGELHC